MQERLRARPLRLLWKESRQKQKPAGVEDAGEGLVAVTGKVLLAPPGLKTRVLLLQTMKLCLASTDLFCWWDDGLPPAVSHGRPSLRVKGQLPRIQSIPYQCEGRFGLEVIPKAPCWLSVVLNVMVRMWPMEVEGRFAFLSLPLRGIGKEVESNMALRDRGAATC